MGTLCACLAGMVLAASAWHTGPTIEHVLSIGALVITIAAGHMAVAQLRGWHLLRAIGLALVFAGGVTYTLVGTAGRTAEQQQAAEAQAAAHAETKARLEAERARIVGLRGKAEAMLAEAHSKHATESASGRGSKCRGIKATIEVYEAAVTGRSADLATIDAGLAELGGDVPANGKLVAAASLIEAVTGAPAEATVKRLTVAWPYVLPLVLEIGSIVFWTIGLGNHAAGGRPPAGESPAATNSPPAPKKRPPTGGGKRGRKLDANVISFQAAYRARHDGKGPTAQVLMHAFPTLGRSTAYEYVKRSA
jgi:hypothetical protein